jgi:hypothetical protein
MYSLRLQLCEDPMEARWTEMLPFRFRVHQHLGEMEPRAVSSLPTAAPHHDVVRCLISALPRLVCILSRWLADLPSPALSAISMALPRCEIASWKAERRSAYSPALPHHSMAASVRAALRKVMRQHFRLGPCRARIRGQGLFANAGISRDRGSALLSALAS